ncbi:FliM/FliN family flagellar motor switch protein [Shewanella sp. KX20019]|uniref:FliM/FliN family flagellar motor switch protein n=1 Tax=Shewanella sp. KX20019 TaxID=2803864 RepID=UPI001926A42A|nr:FliM/FliN family flagellar motor switch protein [Shewanella sp. KX20019]QQX80544.1 FliM/FliN family flagellar motor switch protein [Shewanella sp. KX20019]
MKTTAKASLIKFNHALELRPVVLIKEKLARSRLLTQLSNRQRNMLDAINELLMPIIRQGHLALSNVSLSAKNNQVTPQLHDAWFLLSYNRIELGWWQIDKCTLDQLASGYYGSCLTAPKSPLRAPSHSELRIVKRMILAMIATLPVSDIDADKLELELVLNNTPLKVPVCCELSFPLGHAGPPIHFYMAEHLLELMAEQPSQYQADPELAEKLANRLKQIPLRTSLELGHQSMPVTSLQNVAVGDILPMNLHSRCPLTIGKRPLFYATVHTHEGQMVAKLSQEAFQMEEQSNG